MFLHSTPPFGYPTPYADMSKDLVRGLGAWSGKRAAVVPFRYVDGRPSDGGAVIAAGLKPKNFLVVEWSVEC